MFLQFSNFGISGWEMHYSSRATFIIIQNALANHCCLAFILKWSGFLNHYILYYNSSVMQFCILGITMRVYYTCYGLTRNWSFEWLGLRTSCAECENAWIRRNNLKLRSLTLCCWYLFHCLNSWLVNSRGFLPLITSTMDPIKIRTLSRLLCGDQNVLRIGISSHRREYVGLKWSLVPERNPWTNEMA